MTEISYSISWHYPCTNKYIYLRYCAIYLHVAVYANYTDSPHLRIYILIENIIWVTLPHKWTEYLFSLHF
jgi:hypothetical protein